MSTSPPPSKRGPQTVYPTATEEYDRTTVVGEETEFGLRELDPTDRHLVGLEYWHASRQLPADFLRMLPAPPVPVGR